MTNRFALMTAAATLFCCAYAQSPCSATEWGVCGHPGVQRSYNDIPVARQIDELASLGARWYRVDWPEANYNANPGFYRDLVREAGKKHVKILPVLFPNDACYSKATLPQIKAGAYAYARRVARDFRGKIDYFELENELDNYAITGGDGDRPDEFDDTRVERAATDIRALSEGVKEGNPKAKVIMGGAGWLHYAFIQRLVAGGVPFDILAWHWYSDMGDITKVKGSIDVWTILRGFGKPIWITECNYRNTNDPDPANAPYIARTAAQFRDLGAKVFIAYELLDEPYLDGNERWYGLIQTNAGAGPIDIGPRKDVFVAYQGVIADSKQAHK